MTDVYRRRIPEKVVEGRRLGRHVHHDPRSLQYQRHADGTVQSVSWKRDIGILDQGNLGSCTGNAAVGALGTDPDYGTLSATLKTGLKLDEAEAVKLYSDAEKIDGGQGYPPEDEGSSGLSVAKAAKNAGLISGYLHMTSVAACQTAIQHGPFIVGTNWYSGMDNPDSNGLVTATGYVRGGHEYECTGYDAQADLWWFCNSWGESWGKQGTFCYSSATFAKLLAEQGDATQFVPLSAPAPTPTPPNPAPPGPDPSVVATLEAALRRFIPHHSCPEYLRSAAQAWLG